MAEAGGDEKGRIRALYRRRARDYDWSLPLWRLGGFRETAYRQALVAALGLRPGDTVVDLGCGTGRNFPLLEGAVGPSGSLLGVDFSGPMLERARQRADRAGWSNISLMEADAAELDYPDAVNGVAAAFAFGAMPDYEAAIARAAAALAPGGRLAMLELTTPERWPDWLADLGIRLMAPYGATQENARNKPWQALPAYFDRVSVSERYFGAAVLAVGEGPRSPAEAEA